jgi:hypothetical protein
MVEAEMLFCQGIGDWQKDIPKVDQKAGYRADEFPVHVVLARRRFRALSGQIGTHSGFQVYPGRGYHDARQRRQGLDAGVYR